MVGVAPPKRLGDDWMMPVVFALFDDLETADEVAGDLATPRDGEPGLVLSVHRDRLDELVLPESAMRIGRMLYLALGSGAAIGLVGGLMAGSFLSITGLGPGMGAVLGLVSGVLLGALCAMMAGARSLQPELADVASRLERGKALIAVEAGADQLERVELAFESAQALEYASH